MTEVHTSLLLMCLLDVGLPDILVEVIVSSDAFVSLQACIFLGKSQFSTVYFIVQRNRTCISHILTDFRSISPFNSQTFTSRM